MSGILTSGKLVLTDSEGNVDAFGRIRVSEPQTLFEIHHVFGKENYVMDELISGSGTSTHNSSGSYVALEVANTDVGKAIRQSYEYIPYQSGKSKLMLFTGVMEVSGGVANSTERVGCFDSNVDKTSVSGTGNGHFFELDDTTMYVVERKNNDDTKVAQASWNVDALDGNGPSGLTISSWDKANIFAIDQEWLGVGTIRMGIYVNGTFKECHRFDHSGLGTPASTAITTPYTKTAKLPVRYEISSDSSVNAEMRMMCSTVISEGGFEPVGRVNGFSRHSSVSLAWNSSGTFTPIFSLRLKETEPENRGTAVIKNVHLLNITNNRYINFHIYMLTDDSKLTDESFSDIDSTNSIVQYDTSATAVDLTGSISIGSGFAKTKASKEYSFEKYLNSPIINSHIDGKSRILCLAAINLTSNTTVSVYAGFEWIEIK